MLRRTFNMLEILYHGTVASMRPQHNAAENSPSMRWRPHASAASMRPQHNAAEN